MGPSWVVESAIGSLLVTLHMFFTSLSLCFLICTHEGVIVQMYLWGDGQDGLKR